MKAWLAAAALVGVWLSGTIGTAVAADHTRPGYWNGFYVGANVGYGSRGANVSYSDYPAGFFSPAFDVGQLPRAQSPDPEGLLGGIQAGYNRQQGLLVYGTEIDFSAADIEGSSTYSYPGTPGLPAEAVARQSLDWLATVRARVGVSPVDKWLVYMTGGLAFGGTKSDFDIETVPALLTVGGSQDGVRVGYAVGGGVEYALTSCLTTSVEYLYYDLGSETASGPQFTAGVAQPFGLIAKYNFNGDVVRGAIKYHF